MKLNFGIGVALLLFAAPLGAQVQVRQGGTGFTIVPLQSSASAAGFFAYDTVKNASAFTGLELSDTSQLFLYEQTSGSPRPWSLIFIHDRYEDGSAGAAEFRITGLPAGSFYSVRDDNGGPNPGADSYTPDPPAGGTTVANWGWAECCTDGAVLSGLEDERFCIAVDPTFISGIDTWQVLSGPGLTPARTTLPSLNQNVYLCQDCLTLSCPAQITVECTGAKSAFVPLQASGSSLCGGSSIGNDRTGGGADASDTYPVGVTRVLFTLEDVPGFETTCETLVEVKDSSKPTVTSCPPPLALPCDGNPVPLSDPRVQAWLALFSASDSCSNVTLSNDAPLEFPPSCGGTPVTVTFTATDEFSNSATCAATVTLEDLEPPIITSCPAAIDLECDDPAGVPANDPRLAAFFAAFTASDDCGIITLRNDAPAVFPSACGVGQSTTVTFEVEDGCSRTASCTATVTVHDTTPPTITCPLTRTVECTSPGGTPASDPVVDTWRQSVAGADACGTTGISDNLPGFLDSGCAPGRVTQVTFTAVDSCSMAADCSVDLTVIDTAAPVISSCPAPLALECDALGGIPRSDNRVQTWLATFLAADVCGSTALSNDAPTLFPAGCAPGATTPVDFRADDNCANRSGCGSGITVVDTLAPVIRTCPAPLVLECAAGGGIPVTDTRIQDWLKSFAADDACAVAALANDAPAFFPSGCAAGFATTVTFTASDGCTPAASCTSTLTVRDTQPPAITACPAALELECDGAGGIPTSDPRVQTWLASFAANDICGVATTDHNAPAFLPSGCGAGQATTVTFRAVDECGNSATCSATATVRDTRPPTVTTCPAPLVLECTGTNGIPASDPGVVAWLQSFAATDLCDGATLSNDAPLLFSSGCGAGQATTVTFSARDNCANRVECTSTLTVRDSTPPAISTCPVPLALECNSPGGVPATDPVVQGWVGTLSASDICDGATLGNDLPSLLPSGCGPGRTTPVAFHADDNCANRASCASTVTVHDRTAPVITVCPTPLVLECDGPAGIPASDPRIQAWLSSFRAADVCDGAVLSDDAPAFFPSGCAPGLATRVNFAAIDNCANVAACSSTLTVVDTTPPEVTGNRLDGRCLWPPNHKMYCIDDVASTLTVLDLCTPGAPTVEVVGCSSDQPDDAPEGRDGDNGDGHTTGDCRITGGGAGVCVRAERLGGDPSGRHYTIAIEVRDSCGNASRVTAMIAVPHDQSPGRDCEAAKSGK